MECFYCKSQITEGFGVDGDCCEPCAKREEREAASEAQILSGEAAAHEAMKSEPRRFDGDDHLFDGAPEYGMSY